MIQVLLIIAVVALGGALLIVTTYLALVGAMGVLTGERLARCEQCGHLGLTSGGLRHPTGCPAHDRHLRAGHHHLHARG